MSSLLANPLPWEDDILTGSPSNATSTEKPAESSTTTAGKSNFQPQRPLANPDQRYALTREIADLTGEAYTLEARLLWIETRKLELRQQLMELSERKR